MFLAKILISVLYPCFVLCPNFVYAVINVESVDLELPSFMAVMGKDSPAKHSKMSCSLWKFS